MPRADLKTCRLCGRHASDTGPLSHTRLCNDCGVKRKTDELSQLHEHGGPHFDHWRRQVILAAGGIVPDRLDTALEQR